MEILEIIFKDLNIIAMNKKELIAYKSGLKLSKVQREIVVGKLLGDAHLSNYSTGLKYKFMIEHSLNQKAYVDWLYGYFKDWVLTPPKEKNQLIKGKLYKKYLFNTFSHIAFRFYALQFYKNGKKIVPKLIDHWLTPLGLAVWFMDDGSIKSKHHRALILNTQCYENADLKRLQDVLLAKFGIQTKLRKQKEGKQIYILSKTVEQFVKLIRPFILPEMEYKLNKLR